MNKLLGGRIKSLRSTANFTQEQIADQIGISRQKYARIESGTNNITLDILAKIANILKVQVGDIIKDFDTINETSDLDWLFRSQLTKFIKRFVADPYKTEEKEWFEHWTIENGIKAMMKFRALRDALK